MNYKGTNLTNDVQYLFTESYIILLREIKRTQSSGVIYRSYDSNE